MEDKRETPETSTRSRLSRLFMEIQLNKEEVHQSPPSHDLFTFILIQTGVYLDSHLGHLSYHFDFPVPGPF